MTIVRFGFFNTSIRACGLAWRGDWLVGCQLPEGSDDDTRARMRRRFPDAIDMGWIEARDPADFVPGWVRIAAMRIEASLAGQNDDLTDLPLDLSSVAEFERQVYAAARAIPYGLTVTYGELARRIGAPGAARAVGRALGRNPFAPIIPCHRILAAGARGGGFSAGGGVATKLRMLVAEGARFGPEPELF